MTNQTNGAGVAERITAIRKDADRSVVWLSEKTGIAEKTLRRRFISPDQFTLAELSAISRALKCDIEDFFTARHVDLAAVA